jgi:hypothetical protein
LRLPTREGHRINHNSWLPTDQGSRVGGGVAEAGFRRPWYGSDRRTRP